MPPLDLAPIRARAEAATEGPWRVQQDRDGATHVEQDAPGGFSVCCTGHVEDDPEATPDATFIAAARTDVPILLAEVARLAEEVERLRVRVEKATRFDMGERIFISQPPDERWVVVSLDGPEPRFLCLDGKWGTCPPNGEIAEWLGRSRFPTLDAAWAALDAARRGEVGKGGGE